MASRVRWRLASQLDKLPGQCWADLASWALRDRRQPWSPNARCPREIFSGSCYCGKLRGDG